MVFKVTGLQFYTETYIGKYKYKGRHSFKERTSEYQRGQQGCSTLQGRIMVTKDNSRDYNDKKEDDSRRK